MAIDPRIAQVAKIVCDHFTLTREGTSRRPLILEIKDPTVLDRMATQSLLREEENRSLYFPTLGTFAILSDDDPNFIAAKTGTIQVLQVLRKIFETGSEHLNLPPSTVLEGARELIGPVDRATFNLGLYLVDFVGLGAVQGYARNNDHVGVNFLSISERIMMVDSARLEWERCAATCRQNAEYSDAGVFQIPIERIQPEPTQVPKKPKQKAWIPDGWTLGKLLEEGGQGWTYKVRRTSDEDREWFVFKRLKNANRADRFRAEIKALRALDHPGILRIVDDGITEEKPYYIAEYCKNGDLSKRNFNGTTTLEKLLLFRQISSAVAVAHSAKIVHRDIKPSNVLLRADGTVAVGDFGLCLHLDEGERFTMTEEAVGGRNYMAPELEDGRRDDVTPAADIYSLGKLLYFLVAGKCFSREKHWDPGYDLTRKADGQTGTEIQFVYEIFDMSIVQDPKKRYQNAGELVLAIDGVMRRIVLNAHVLDRKIKQPCLYCVEGEYQDLPGSQTNEYGIVLACRRCGNVQNFSRPYNGWNAWWMKR